jgi:Ca2+-transporting ATPase
MAAMNASWALVRDYDFDAAGKHMSHVWHSLDTDDAFLVAAKGAVEGVLAHCRLEPEERRAVLEANDRMARSGLRVLAVAGKKTGRLGADREEDERDLVAYGLLGFQDPLRPEVPGAVDECQRAGIRIKMITGDHKLTAHAVTEAAGIQHDDELMMVGEELTALREADRAARIDRTAVFARISPEQKFLIVDGLKKAGEIVAMTGDGVNDAPALRKADIGIAMGQRGTDVARATADLVLLDDNFASIVATVRQGRHILQNIQRAFLYLIAFHIPIVALAVLSPLLGVPLVLLPIHMVWLELIVHPVSALVFQAEPASASVMDRPPRRPDAPLLERGAIVRSALSGGMLAVVSFGMYWWGLSAFGEAQARALALVALLAGYQMLVFAERLALPELVVPRLPRTKMFWTVWWAASLSGVVILFVPQAAEVFRVTPPGAMQMLAAAALGVAAVGWRLAPFSLREKVARRAG